LEIGHQVLGLLPEEVGLDAESGSKEKEKDEHRYYYAAKYADCSGPFHAFLNITQLRYHGSIFFADKERR
jgi:hypothetical protein